MALLNISLAFCILITITFSLLLRSILWPSFSLFLLGVTAVWLVIRFSKLSRLLQPAPAAHKFFLAAYSCIPIFFTMAMLGSASGANSIAAAMFASLFLLPAPVLLIAGFVILGRKLSA